MNLLPFFFARQTNFLAKITIIHCGAFESYKSYFFIQLLSFIEESLP